MGRWAWRVIALAFLALAAVGVALPIVPQIPFLLVAAAAAARGWPALDRRLQSHPAYGPILRRWRERRAIPLQVKVLGSVGLAGAIAAALLLPLPRAGRLIAIVVAIASLLWMWSRPSD